MVNTIHQTADTSHNLTVVADVHGGGVGGAQCRWGIIFLAILYRHPLWTSSTQHRQ